MHVHTTLHTSACVDTPTRTPHTQCCTGTHVHTPHACHMHTRFCTLICTCTHPHVRHKHNPTHMPVYTHPHMPHALTNLHLHMRIHTHTCHTHTKLHTHSVHTHAQTRTHKPALTRTCRHEYTGTHANRHGSGARPCHARVHTHAHTHMLAWEGTWHAEGSPRQQLPGPSGVAASSSPELAPPLATLTPHCHQGALVACCGSQVAPAPSPKPA